MTPYNNVWSHLMCLVVGALGLFPLVKDLRDPKSIVYTERFELFATWTLVVIATSLMIFGVVGLLRTMRQNVKKRQSATVDVLQILVLRPEEPSFSTAIVSSMNKNAGNGREIRIWNN